uniref:Uncharacterized protein n=1 Tax=Glossina austeni TaxID=7395 RepID=A0A1A9UER3_GLOAU
MKEERKLERIYTNAQPDYIDKQPPSKQVNPVESGSPATYETSHHEQVNLVKSEFSAAYETSNACPTDKQVDFEEATPSASLHSTPRSDQHIVSPIVANVDTRPPPLGQWSDISTSESQNSIRIITQPLLSTQHGMNGNIINVGNQLQQQSALHNRPLLQTNVTKHALPSLVAPPALTYKVTDLVEKAANKVSKQQQQTQP